MIFDFTRRACFRIYSCLLYGLPLFRAMRWVRVLKGYANNPASKEEHFRAIRMLKHWRGRCGLSVQEFRRVAHKWGYNVPGIMRILINSQSLKRRP